MSETVLPNSEARKRGICYFQEPTYSPVPEGASGSKAPCGYPEHLHTDGTIRLHEFVPWEGSDYQHAVGDRRDGRDPKHNRRATDVPHAGGVCCCGKPTPCGMTHVQAEVIERRAEQSKGPTQMRGAIAPGELGDDEPCRHCFVRRGEHDTVTSHDYEGIFLYTCEGCAPDVAWDSDNMSEHPDYDHDFAWIPLDMDDRERPKRVQQKFDVSMLRMVASLAGDPRNRRTILDAADEIERLTNARNSRHGGI